MESVVYTLTLALSIQITMTNTMTIQVAEKSVYGKTLIYPVCETALKFAALLVVKTFNYQQLRGIEALGYTVECQKLPA